ncbi:hypothetical protein [Alteromonas halophila]|uniref:Surface antigen domain-containing protein n=1 Tax=Alteromonas halophila TaxID=516698 RepID=A0A918MWN8_9ALTE|nr:hypothetical protein [Alteromonas halophila]GGW78294.1 hypothetical protein GCM10007391_08580 [Alteromonas halophila]
MSKRRALAVSSLSLCLSLVLSGCESTGLSQTLQDYGLPVPNQNDDASTGKKILAGISGCAVGGAVAYYGSKYVGDKLRDKGYNYTDEEVKKATMVIAGLGCVIGGKVALNIVKNMDEESKRAQEAAWEKAQQQSKAQNTRTPQAWQTETHAGTVEIVNPVSTDDGRECATRKNYITSDAGTAEQYIPVCKNSDGSYEAVEV